MCEYRGALVNEAAQECTIEECLQCRRGIFVAIDGESHVGLALAVSDEVDYASGSML